MSRSPSATLALVAIGLGAAACSGKEQVAPVSTGEGGAGGATSASVATAAVTSSVSATTTSAGSTGSGAVFRTIFERNPFGEQTDNLLADGDFELSFGRAGQQGWTGYTSNGSQDSLLAETGGLCKSGLRCARVPAGNLLLARGTAAPDDLAMSAEIWVKPLATPSCVGLEAIAINCESFAPKATLTGIAVVDEDGWCTLRGEVPFSRVAVCIYVENNSDQEMLFDAASLRALPPQAAPSPSPVVPPVPADTRARMDCLRDRVRSTMPLGPPPVLPPGQKPRPGRPYAEPLDLGP